mgnify:CR=1 FL=1
MKRLIYAEDAMHRIEMETRFYSGTYAEIERAIERAIDSAPTVDPRCLRPVEEWISDSGVCFCDASPIVPTSLTAMTAAVTGSRKSCYTIPGGYGGRRMNLGTAIKCCPLCGGRIVVSNLYQYSLDYTMRKDGKIGKWYKRGNDGSMNVSLASCENYKTCDARWEEEEFFVEPDGTFLRL